MIRLITPNISLKTLNEFNLKTVIKTFEQFWPGEVPYIVICPELRDILRNLLNTISIKAKVHHFLGEQDTWLVVSEDLFNSLNESPNEMAVENRKMAKVG